MLDFAQNFNVFKVEGLKKLIQRSTDFIYRYPDYQHHVLKNSIAKKFKITKDSIAIGNGATELLFALPASTSKKDAIICYPTFWEYTTANKNRKNIINFITNEDNNFQLKFEDLEASLTESCVVYLCNPNNPTSTLIDAGSLSSFIENHPTIDFVIDETYLLFREDYHEQSLLKKATEVRNLYVITSLSKMFFIPGLRIGFLVSHQDHIAQYIKNTTPYLTNPLLESVVPYLLSKNKYIRKTKTFYSRQRLIVYKRFSKEFQGIFKVFKPEANFILLKILTSHTSTEIVKKLEEHGVTIRDGVEFKGLGNKWIRIGIRTPKEEEVLFVALHKIL